MEYRIPFNKPCLAGDEVAYIQEAVRAGHLSGDGIFTRKSRKLLESELGSSAVLLTTSCTHALEMMALLLEIGPGDEVIVPSFTFVSTANAFKLRGAILRFVDIRPDTMNMDERLLPAAITPRTKAVVPVHYAGVACEMEEIMSIAGAYGCAVVEDNAHGLFGRYRGKPLGTFGVLAAQSFHETKNIVCGEGGALIVNDPAFVERAEYIREKGTNRNRFFRGQVDKYTWVDIGSSYVLSDMLAAFLYAQLEHRQEIQRRRKAIWTRYADELAEWAGQEGVQLPCVPDSCEQAYHMFYMVLPTLEDRQELIARLRERGILAVFHYLPLHLSEVGRELGGLPGQCPVTEYVSDRLLRLPFYNDMTMAEQDAVIDVVKSFRVTGVGTHPRQTNPAGVVAR